MTVDALGEHVNANPEAKKQAIEHEIELWGEDAYDRNYLIQNMVFCPSCNKVSRFKDWASSISKKRQSFSSQLLPSPPILLVAVSSENSSSSNSFGSLGINFILA